MQLRRVILYQNGIGYFERTGVFAGQKLQLRFARPELDDVLKTLTVIDRLGGSVAMVDVPTTTDRDRSIDLGVRLGASRAHDLLVGYAVPTPTWKAAYRVVLDDKAALLQGWAMVNNASQEDWKGVSLTLATGAPMSFATNLQTPEYVKRPDATGHLIAPTVLGPIDGEKAGPLDNDRDGLPDEVDKCPDTPEDHEGFDDADGCPELDRDHDSLHDSRKRVGALDAATVKASAHARAKPAAVAGSVRFELGEPVSIPRGASTMVAILNKSVTGEDVFLFRPDANGPGSDRHPFRAVRMVNQSGYTLEPGPVAIFAHGTFVGDSLLQRLEVDETAWIPYALDGGTTVTVAGANVVKPVRLAAIHRGVVTVESAAIRTTRYTVAAGRDVARVIYIRHRKAPGFDARGLPPNTIDQGDSYLVPLALAPAKPAVLAIEERQPRRKTIGIADGPAGELAAYFEGAPAEIAEKLRVAIALRKELAAIDDEVGVLRKRIGDLSQRATEIRDSIRTLDKVPDAAELRKKLVASLAQTTADSDAVARSLGKQTEVMATARSRLADAIRELALDEVAGP
jgi:hypothetical protein